MPGIFKRMFDIVKSVANHHFHNAAEEVLSALENRYQKKRRVKVESNSSGFKQDRPRKPSGNTRAQSSPTDDTPKQIREDLALFKLEPPVTMIEIRKARNREFKKYHSDRFLNDPEKFQVSKEIMQIYNAAYERMKAYYKRP